MQGLSEFSGDTRVLRLRLRAGNKKARLAWDVFVHRLRAGIGQMLAALRDRPHAIVFTDAISEDDAQMRIDACAPFAFLGLEIDVAKNRHSPLDTDLATTRSQVRVLLLKSREAWQIARECHTLLSSAGP